MSALEIVLLTIVCMETPLLAVNIYFVVYHESENRKYMAFLQEQIRNGQRTGTGDRPSENRSV